ncbi:hypothetical protein [Bacteroides graminisolvens]
MGHVGAVGIVVLIIILLQLYFFIKNLKRMHEFRDIFLHGNSWQVTKDSDTDFVSGINGAGNSVYKAIENSINKYLANNKGAVIDFHLLKDAVDRHCDSIEDDINAQTPVPLYCGLAGTMVGVIIGLWSLLSTNSLTNLMGGDAYAENSMVAAASGVNDLLGGVAWAMVASIVGIALTTINSIRFKNCKLKEENGKNSFLAWMQARLLPELSTDMSDSLTKLVKNLNRFNSDFALNSKELRNTFKQVNETYSIHANVIKTIHEMDVMKMASVNVNVLRELQNTTGKLELFNEYLDSVKGYTDTIQKFNSQFHSESERLHVLEQIRDFFKTEMSQIEQRKAEIAKTVGNVDLYLKDSLTELGNNANLNLERIKQHLVLQSDIFKTFLDEEKLLFLDMSSEIRSTFSKQSDLINENAMANIDNMNQRLMEQSNLFHSFIDQEKNMFQEISRDISTRFSEQMQLMPQLIQQLNVISEIPGKLDKIVSSIERKDLSKIEDDGYDNVKSSNIYLFPKWMNWTILAIISIIALACVVNTLHSLLENRDSKLQGYIHNSTPLRESIVDVGNVDSSALSLDSIYSKPVN